MSQAMSDEQAFPAIETIDRRRFILSASAFGALCAGALRAADAAPAFNLRLEQLTLRVGATNPFGALHFSDTHLTSATAAELAAAGAEDRERHEKRSKAMPKNAAAFAASLAYAKGKGLLPIHTGDLVDYLSDGNIELARRSLAGTKTLITPGNHETTGFPASRRPKDAASAAETARRIEAAYGERFLVSSRSVGGVRFVGFDNGGLSKWRIDEQLSELEREISKEGGPVVLLCHFPPFEQTLLEHIRKREKNGRQKPVRAYMMMDERLNGIIRSHPSVKAVLCGHLHFSWRGMLNDSVHLVVAPANLNGSATEITFC